MGNYISCALLGNLFAPAAAKGTEAPPKLKSGDIESGEPISLHACFGGMVFCRIVIPHSVVLLAYINLLSCIVL